MRDGLRAFLAYLILFFATPCLAVDDAWEAGPGAKDPSVFASEWHEQPAAVPPYPVARELVPVAGGQTSTLRLYFDPTSISVGDDDVVRLTYVIDSAGGVRNVFFAGIRCATKEYKLYAADDGGQRLVPVKHPGWEELPYHEDNTFRYTLAQKIICAVPDAPLTPRTVDAALRDFPAR